MVRFLAIVVLACASALALRRAAADGLARSGDTARAALLEPANADYRLGGSEGPSDEDLKAALEVDPQRSSAWIELAVRAELAGDFSAAERYFQQGARVSRQYDARWALASFYFRRGERSKFLTWARASAEMAYGDDGQLFELCHQTLSRPADVLSQCLAEQPPLLSRYLSYLLNGRRAVDAEPVAIKLAAAGRPMDRDELLKLCDELLTRGSFDSAMRVWNAASRGGVIPRPEVDDSNPVLMNSGFSRPLLERGFDWRLASSAEVRAVPDLAREAVHFYLSGKQPEDFILANQLVPVRGGRLRFRHDSSGDSEGFRWAIFEEPGGRELTKHSQFPLAASQWEIVVPASTRMIRIALVYRRPNGAANFEGTIRIAGLALRRV